MGVNFSKCSNVDLGVKRLRTDYLKTNFTLNNADSTDQASPFAYSVWQNLPYEILVEIYRYLPNNDKLSMSLTCKSWSQPFSRPEVWQEVKFRFNGVDDWRALKFADSLVSGLRHLSIDCTTSGNSTPYGEKKKTAYNLHTFLHSCKNCRLVTLKLTKMGHFSHWFQRSTKHDIVRVLGELLSTQTNLRTLDLSKAGFCDQQGNTILNLVSPVIGPTIRILALSQFFHHGPVCIANHLRSFTRLRELTVSDDNLSDDLLKVLADATSLSQLNVFVQMSADVLLPSKDAWLHLKTSRPTLIVRYAIQYKKLGRFKILKRVLTSGIPLVVLELKWSDIGPFWQLLCHHIAYKFQNHLKRLDIIISKTMVWEDHFLDAIIEKCLLLEEISVNDEYGYNSSLHAPIKMSVRRALARQPESHLRKFTLNGKEVNLKLSWMRSVADWVSERID